MAPSQHTFQPTMLRHAPAFTILLTQFILTLASPAQEPYNRPSLTGHGRFFDIQAHRGGRGNTVESTLPSFAWHEHVIFYDDSCLIWSVHKGV